MAKEYEGGMCRSNWWASPTTTRFDTCSSSATGWLPEASNTDSTATCAASMMIDPSLEVMGLGHSSQALHWTHPPTVPSVDGSVICQGMANFKLDSPSIYNSLHDLMGSSDPQQQQHQLHYSASNYEQHHYFSMPSNVNNPEAFQSLSNNEVPHQFFESSMPQQTAPSQHNKKTQFINNSQSFWNADDAALRTEASPSLHPSLQTHLGMHVFDKNPELIHQQKSQKKNGSKTGAKRPRNNTASSTLPPFKVRKEKMGSRISALQQLVSPFGKTDTASVLSEAIDYIKFLHEQISVLSIPYSKNGTSFYHQQRNDKSKPRDGEKQDLRSRGLCLVPISSTFPLTQDSSIDYWTPTYGGSCRQLTMI